MRNLPIRHHVACSLTVTSSIKNKHTWLHAAQHTARKQRKALDKTKSWNPLLPLHVFTHSHTHASTLAAALCACACLKLPKLWFWVKKTLSFQFPGSPLKYPVLTNFPRQRPLIALIQAPFHTWWYICVGGLTHIKPLHTRVMEFTRL